MRIVTTAQMKEIERRGDASGLSYYQMMENAGTAAYHFAREQYPNAKHIVIFCGKGNNGGDGFVVARLLSEEEIPVTVMLVEGTPVTEDAKKNYSLLPPAVTVLPISDPLPECDLMLDALYGTGFHGELRPKGARACRLMNEHDAPVIALDLPSGCNADSAEACDGAVQAADTVAFDSWKHVHQPAHPSCGICHLADIGIPEECHDNL